MFRRHKTALFSWTIAIIVCAVSAMLVSRALAARDSDRAASAMQTTTQTRTPAKVRNLSLQPEAFKLSHRLGHRFSSAKQNSATLTATITKGGVQRTISISRQQTATGEDVSASMAGDAATLTWNDIDGSRVSSATLTEDQRLLIERLALDTPDQFVLAQLRGASYYAVAHNVRADEGGSDNYSGPLWDVIRVDEPEGNGARRPLSTWRLYYINQQTGLIDKIVSEFRGQKIEANVVAWIDQAGEKLPSHVVWNRDNDTILDFQLTTFAVQPQQ